MELWQTWEIEREKGEGKSPPVIEQSRHCDEHHEKEKRLVDADDDNYFSFFDDYFFLFLFLMMIILTFSCFCRSFSEKGSTLSEPGQCNDEFQIKSVFSFSF